MDANLVGQNIQGRYRIVRQLGRGGVGITFLAEDLQCFNSPCVVKQLKPRSNNSKNLEVTRRLFNREAEILNDLGHCDRIPRLLAYFEYEGDFFLVQELIEGKDLSQEIIINRPWSEAKTIKLLSDILEILSVVQQHRVIHRDLKPSNLMRRAKNGEIVMIDFGSVKQVSTQVIDRSGQMKLTVAVGTKSYMPTEQMMGHPGFYSDIYAVGIIAIQTLTGVHPQNLLVDNDGELIWRDRLRSDFYYNPRLLDILAKMVRYRFQERYIHAENALLDVKQLSLANDSDRTTVIVNSRQQKAERYFQTPPNSESAVDRTKIIPSVRQNKPQSPPPSSRRKPRLILIFSILSAIAVIVVWGFWRYKGSAPVELVPYESEERGFQIEYPKAWSQRNRDDFVAVGVIFISASEDETDNFQENVSVLVENLSSSMSLEKYTDESIAEIQKLSDPAVTFPKSVNLGKNQAKTVIYQGEENGHPVRRMQTWLVDRDRAYIVTYTAAPERYNFYLPTVKKMLDSFRLVSQPAN